MNKVGAAFRGNNMPAKLNRRFSISIHIEQSFSIDEVWPDKNGPENPTVDDVKKVFFEGCYNVHDRCDEWGLTIGKSDVWITDDEAMRQHLLDFNARQAAAESGDDTTSAAAAELPPDLYASISAADDDSRNNGPV